MEKEVLLWLLGGIGTLAGIILGVYSKMQDAKMAKMQTELSGRIKGNKELADQRFKELADAIKDGFDRVEKSILEKILNEREERLNQNRHCSEAVETRGKLREEQLGRINDRIENIKTQQTGVVADVKKLENIVNSQNNDIVALKTAVDSIDKKIDALISARTQTLDRGLINGN